MVTSGLNPETIDKYRQVSKNVWVVDCLPWRLFCQWILSSGSGCISSDPTSHHGTSMITLFPTSSCSGFYSHAPEVPRVLRVIGRYILLRGTFLIYSLQGYILAEVVHMCSGVTLPHKHVRKECCGTNTDRCLLDILLALVRPGTI